MFNDIVGHENIKRKLQEDIKYNELSHAYVFYGQSGIGKRTLALSLVKELLGTKNLEACVDFKLIKKADGKQDITVEQIRNTLVTDMYIAPAASKYKVYIIDDAGSMNESAQNALLKTLEEPPSYVIMILIANSLNSLIPTIISRTNNIFFKNLTIDEEKQVLNLLNKNIDERILKLSVGSVGQALDIQDNDIINCLENAIDYIKSKNILNLLLVFNNIDFKKTIILDCFQRLLLENALYELVDVVEAAKNSMQNNASEEIEKTALAIKLCR